MDPALVPLKIKQRVEYRRDFRFKSGALYTDLTGYTALAQIYDEERITKYGEFDVIWLNRIITNTAIDGDYHLRISLPEAQTILTVEDAFWDLRMIPPDVIVQPPFYPVEGKITYQISYTDDDT